MSDAVADMAAAGRSAPRRPMTVCCFPLSLPENAVLDILYAAMSKTGLRLVAYRWLGSIFASIDIFHVHWPDAVVMGRSRWRSLVKFAAFVASVQVFRWRRIPVVYSVHNVGSHDGRFPLLERCLWAWFLPRVDAFIHMNEQSRLLLATKGQPNPRARTLVIPHPHYRVAREKMPERSTARSRLAMSPAAFVILAIGLIRPYKGLERLIAAFADYDDADAVLVIAGRPVDAAYVADISERAGRDRRIRLDVRFLPPAALDDYMMSADHVVLAHRGLMNSGVALLALSYDRPLIAPANGAILDLRVQTGPAWVTTFGAEGLTAKTIGIARASRLGLPDGARPNIAPNDPERIADSLHALYRSLTEPSDAQGSVKAGRRAS